MKFVVTLLLDGSGKGLGGLPAGKYVRIYESDRVHLLIERLQQDNVFADDLLEVTIQPAQDYT